MDKYYSKTINVTDLQVNPNNVRYEEAAEDQTDAMRMIITDQGKKFVNLAKHIAHNGLEPGRSIYVHPIGNNKFTVLDGNRRMSAVKVLLSKDLQEEFKDLLPKSFGAIVESFNLNNRIEFVPCIVFPVEKDAKQWIAVNHGFGADGITTQDWNSNTRDKVMASFGQKKRERDGQVLDYLRQSPLVEEAFKERLIKGKTNNTTLRRILSDDTLPEIGIRFEKGLLSFAASDREIVKTLVRIVSDLLDKKVKVERVWDEQARKQYFNDLRLEGDMPDLTLTVEDEATTSVANSEGSQKNQQGDDSSESDNDQSVEKVGKTANKRPRGIKTSREYVLSRSFKIKNRSSRVTDIYNELTRIKVTDNPNAVSLLLRAFVEMIIKEYGRKYSIPGIGKQLSLADSTEKVVSHYLNQKRQAGEQVDEGDFRGIREACDKANANSIFAIESFQQLVHREKLKPIASEVVDRWDNIETAIVLILDNM